MTGENPSSGEMMRRVGFGGGLAIGMGVGVALGVGFDNMALGIGLGVSIGTIFMIAFASAGSRLMRSEREQGPASGEPDDEPRARADGIRSRRDR